MSKPVGSDFGLEEWQEARAVLARFDDNLHDLRKYGFSFVTGLLTADTLLGQAAANANVVVSDYVKLAVFVVTLGLICTLRLLDKHYRRFQEAAAVRARILENRLNLDLSGTIAYFYDITASWRYVHYVYVGFVLLTGILGLAVLWPDAWALGGLAIAVVVALGFVLGIHVWKGRVRATDWSVDKKVAFAGDSIRITLTNLAEVPFKIPANYVAWAIYGMGKEEDTSFGTAPVRGEDLFLKRQLETYDWLWDVSVKPGLYRLVIGPVENPRYVTTLQVLRPRKGDSSE